tara:strand:+ start:1114 stop:1317 length:204 start_codon:yes stop_codon:yes gene_type:complete
MSLVNRSHRTKNVRMNLRNGDSRKQAGSNRLEISVQSSDWRIQDQAVSMTIRDAKALQCFLNQHLGE